MFTIGIICLFALVTCNDYGVEYDDYYSPQDSVSGSGHDDESGSGSGDDVIITTTIIPVKDDDKGGGGGGGAIVGGILGGLCVFAGLAMLGRRFCALNKKEKEKDDKDLDYDYYGIIQRRTSSSYV